jgi:hypothetical protein
MSGSTSTTVSPSSTVFRWSTPWVEGVVGPDVDEHRIGVGSLAAVVLLEGVGVLTEGDDLWLGLVVIQRERVALPGLGQEDPAEVGVVLVLDTDEVVGLPLVPVSGSIDAVCALADWFVLGRRDDDRQFLCGVVVFSGVIDGLVAVLALLGGHTGTVVEAGVRFQCREDFLNLVGPNDGPLGVDVGVTLWNLALEERFQRVAVETSSSSLTPASSGTGGVWSSRLTATPSTLRPLPTAAFRD